MSPSFPVPSSSFIRLQAVSTHVTLVPTSEAVPFVPPFLSFGIVQAAPLLAPVCMVYDGLNVHARVLKGKA